MANLFKTIYDYLFKAEDKSVDQLRGEAINVTALSETGMNKTSIDESIVDFLLTARKTGSIHISEFEKKEINRMIKDLFISEHKLYTSASKDENWSQLYVLDGKIRLKAGEILESIGVLSEGITKKQLQEKGYTLFQDLHKNGDFTKYDFAHIHQVLSYINVADSNDLHLLYEISNNKYANFFAKMDIEGVVTLKAGEFLERNGLVPVGTTEHSLREEGWKVDKLRECFDKAAKEWFVIHPEGYHSTQLIDLEDKSYNINSTNALFLAAVNETDFAKIVQLSEEDYRPSPEVLNSLVKSGIQESALIAVQKIFNLELEQNDVQLTNSGNTTDIHALNQSVDAMMLN